MTSVAGASSNLDVVSSTFAEAVFVAVMREQADSGNATVIPNTAVKRELTMRDGIVVSGFQLTSQRPNPKDCILVAGGNAQLARKVVASLQSLAANMDVFVFDYRGFGQSGGKTSAKALILDYADIIQHLKNDGFTRIFAYGISFGGFVVLNASIGFREVVALIIDSTPSRIDFIKLAYQPISVLPDDSSRVLVISGTSDESVPPKRMRELIELARTRRAKIAVLNGIGHPYDPARPETDHETRISAVETFIRSTP